MRLLDHPDWLLRVVDAAQAAATPDLCPCSGQRSPDLVESVSAARAWLATALEDRVTCDGGLEPASPQLAWERPPEEPAAAAWRAELLFVRHLTELVAGLRAHFSPHPHAADEQDALIALVLARRELLLSVVRLLGTAWLRGHLELQLRPAFVAAGRAMRRRLGGPRRRSSRQPGVTPMPLADELAAAAEAALYILERQLTRHDRDLRIGALDGEQRVALAGVLAALAWADGKLCPEERHAFAEQTARLSLTPAERKRAFAALRSREASLGDLPERLRGDAAELTLERAIWTSLVDGEQAPAELALLDQLAKRLALSETQQAAVEDRVLRWFERDHLLLGVGRPAGGGLLYLRVQQRVAGIVRLNLRRIVTEVRETGELSVLLVKAGRGQPLTAEEKRKVVAQLLDIAKTIPALAVFALPGGGILLPVLLKLLPFNLLPSAFSEVTED